MRALAALAVVAAVGSVGPAWAQQDCSALLNQGYDCAVPITPGQPVGELSKYGAAVQQAGGGGYSPTNTSLPLHPGDQVSIGSAGMTFITAGPACQARQLPVNALVQVTVVGECAGIKIVRPATVARGGNGAGAAVGLAALGGGGIAAALLINHQKSVSP